MRFLNSVKSSTCLICKRKFSCLRGLAPHLKQAHKLSSKEYYLKYSKVPAICEYKKQLGNNPCFGTGIPPFLGLSKGFQSCCSSFCSANLKSNIENKKQTNLLRYGTEHGFQCDSIKEKIKQTNLRKYGVTVPAKNKKIKQKMTNTLLKNHGVKETFYSKAIKEKIGQTNLERYGEDNYLKTKEGREKIKQTNLRKYGTEHATQCKAIKEKIKITNLKKYGVEYPLQNKKIKQKMTKTLLNKHGVENYKQKHISKNSLKKLNDCEWLKEQHHKKKKSAGEISYILNLKSSKTVCDYLKKHGIEIKRFKVSSSEKELQKFIKKIYKGVIETNTRNIITPLELDIYLPELKLAIEYNGLYWHSEKNGKNRNYHLNKLKICQKKGIRLIQIFDNEWLENKKLVKNRIRNILGLSKRIFARNTLIKIIEVKTKTDFFTRYHIQGSCPSSIDLGLLYKEKVVALMSFGKSRYNKKYEWELLRFATKNTVVGGASKLFKYFIKNYDPKSIISYCDLRWNIGRIYQTLGFTFSHNSAPNYFYFDKQGKLKSRIGFQKHKLKNKLKKFDKSLSEYENMRKNGYNRIWDCGNSVWGFPLSL